MSSSVIILAAGLGLRMRPLTEHMPKPLVPVAGKALIDYAIEFVQQAGCSPIIVNASYKAEMMRAHLHEKPVHISYEDTPLETGGGIAKALPLLGDSPFFALNSDAITLAGEQHPFSRMLAQWNNETMDALLLLQPTDKASGYDGVGDFFLDDSGELTRRGNADSAPYVFTGVQLLHPRLFQGCPDGAFSMNTLYNKDLSRVKGMVHNGAWLHVGDPAGLTQAEAFIKEVV